MNQQLFGADARAKLKAGIDKVFQSVSCTLGSNGRNVVFNKWSRVPIITNDGVSIAREIEPEDLGELQGANLIKQVAERTNDAAGDGTTTSIVLAHSIIEQGMKLIDSDSTINPMKLRREIKDATEKVIESLKTSAQPITTLEALEQVATISVESPEIGKLIAKAIFDAGDNGIVYVNESNDIGVSVEQVQGYQFPQGMITPYLIKNHERIETVLENPALFITELPLHFTNEFSEMIKKTIETGCNKFLIICDEVHPDVIKFAVMNMAKGNFDMAIVKKPMQKEYLEDIAAIAGATAMTMAKGIVHPRKEYLGSCQKIIVTDKNTTIFMGAGDSATYITSLKTQCELAEDENTKVRLQERIAKLTGGVYMLNVGDKTEAERRHLKDKVDDAVNATKAAKEEGIIAGGGSALFRVAAIFNGSTINGEKIIASACLTPMQQIVENSGENFSDICAKIIQMNTQDTNNIGFDATTLEVVPDMIQSGIIDPVKVTRLAFENASTFAGLLLTIEALSTSLPEKDTLPLKQ